MESAIGSSRLDVRGVRRGHRKMHTAVCRNDLKSGSFPTVSGKCDIDTAIRCPALHVTCHVHQADTAILSFEFNPSFDRTDADTSVLCFEIQIDRSRYEKFI